MTHISPIYHEKAHIDYIRFLLLLETAFNPDATNCVDPPVLY